MFKTNVDGTTTVLDAAVSAGVQKIVYLSTVGVFGNTRGRVVDETYERPDRDFLSYYDATKYMAHRVAVARQAAGAPLVIAQPGAVYGRATTASSAPRSCKRRGASTRSAPSRSWGSRWVTSTTSRTACS
jgi:nucleoside-diphosphate-sugar epimerase